MNLIDDALQSVLIRARRSIGEIVPNVVIEEVHQDALTITEHPVEQGAAIADHAYVRPAEVVMRCGFGPGNAFSRMESSDPAWMYQQLRALQASRQPFDVITGKRAYRNMLIRQLTVTTAPESEHALMVTAALRQVLIVQTQTATLPPSEHHAAPEKTAEIQNLGTKQLKPVRSSILSKMGSFSGALGFSQ
ncbi:Putative phage-related protein [Candidatus Glomeribacter gigasporarum BEG34]|uniref:Putative phage-related protein n=1 Tax=Candidatus Glomeribacter gigasporarum BEG34 TaxID=1070319 RepID=G2JBI6_9BURK|nr:hypothetical protein [Candidatus Glomeribacter gigasporarum]CCD30140.1 Putative phage-related protein [Candidatus Glomeribacter gigasporarum BEG34]